MPGRQTGFKNWREIFRDQREREKRSNKWRNIYTFKQRKAIWNHRSEKLEISPSLSPPLHSTDTANSWTETNSSHLTGESQHPWNSFVCKGEGGWRGKSSALRSQPVSGVQQLHTGPEGSRTRASAMSFRPVDSLIIDLVSMLHRADLDTSLSLSLSHPLYASRSHVDRTNTNGRVSRRETVVHTQLDGKRNKEI